MNKYDKEFKLKVVKEYLEGTLGYRLLAKKYGIPGKSQVRRWVRAYKEFGENAFNKQSNQKVYPVQFKLNVLNFRKETGASYADTATAFNIMNSTLIATWNKKFLEEGIEGLSNQSKGWPPMSKRHQSKQKNKEKKHSREELEHENELLRLEVAYLKKLKAFQENPDAFLEKHKQQWHSNSKKKGLN